MSETADGKLRQAIFMALHSYQGADKRWAKVLEHDPSDAELLGYIGEEFGSYGGFMGAGLSWNAWGGRNPMFEHTSDPRRRSVWKGRALVLLAREILGAMYVQKTFPFVEALA